MFAILLVIFFTLIMSPTFINMKARLIFRIRDIGWEPIQLPPISLGNKELLEAEGGFLRKTSDGLLYMEDTERNIDFEYRPMAINNKLKGGVITVYHSSDKKNLEYDVNVETGEIKHGNYVRTIGLTGIKNQKTLIPRIDSNIIDNRVVVSSTLRLQNLGNVISVQPKHGFAYGCGYGAFKKPKAKNENGEEIPLGWKLEKKKDGYHIIVEMEGNAFNNASVVDYDPDFDYDSEAEWATWSHTLSNYHYTLQSNTYNPTVVAGTRVLGNVMGTNYNEAAVDLRATDTQFWTETEDLVVATVTADIHSSNPNFLQMTWDSTGFGEYGNVNVYTKGCYDKDHRTQVWTEHRYAGWGLGTMTQVQLIDRTDIFAADRSGVTITLQNTAGGKILRVYKLENGSATQIGSTASISTGDERQLRLTIDTNGYVEGAWKRPLDVSWVTASGNIGSSIDGDLHFHHRIGTFGSYLDTITVNVPFYEVLDGAGGANTHFTSGSIKSPAINTGVEYIKNTTVVYSNGNAANYIDKFEWLVGAVVKAECAANIYAGVSKTYLEADMTAGTYGDVTGANVYLRFTLSGLGNDSIIIDRIYGEFGAAPSPPIPAESRQWGRALIGGIWGIPMIKQ